MAKKLSLIGLAGIIISIFFTGLKPAAGSAAEAPVQMVGSQTESTMLNATVSITMYGYKPASESAAGIVSEAGQPGRIEGLGTVVVHDGEELIITHNHWTLLNAELELVQIHNAQQELLATMTGEEFFGLIRYQDDGTMVLSKPAFEGSVQTVSWNNAGAIRKGTVVEVVHRRRDEQGGVAVVAATVESIEAMNGVPTFRLRSLNGHVIVPGDSGGGIWVDGELVGNLWTTLVVNIKAQAQGTETMEDNWSQAAVLMQGVQDQLVSVEEVAGQAGADADAPVTMAQESGLAPVVEGEGIG